MRKSSATLRNALLLLGSIIVFLGVALFVSNSIG